MATHKLTYFDFSGSRGEECRLALHLAKVPFDDVRIDRATWLEMKPKTPYGSLPILEVEGKGTLTQSNAILQYIGNQHGLLPRDPWESARHEAVMCAVEELRGHMTPSLRAADDETKKKLREDLAQNYLARWGENVERQIRGPFVGGEKISVADLKLFTILRWITSGVLDHIPAALWENHPKLTALQAAVESHPDVADWYSKKKR